MKALITGVTGFVGSHLASYLLGEGIEVVGTCRRQRDGSVPPTVENIRLVECELRDKTAVEAVIAAERPDYLFHLAAQSFVPASWASPGDTIHNNVAGQVHLLDAIRRLKLPTKVLIAGSSEEYGEVLADEIPVNEHNPLRPMNPYAISKIAQDFLGMQYYRQYGIPVVRMRTFNHIGPGQSEHFVTSSFAKQIAEIEKGLRPPVLYVGNLDAQRDFTDVRDVVRAYWLAIQHGAPGDCYNIASGRSHSIGELLQLLLLLSPITVSVQQDAARMRPSDVPIVVGNAAKFTRLTGWTPEIPIETTMQAVLHYWRTLLSQS
ncbi:GDP-4-dehydro-6-deoxy-D-mannose reductase [Paenibacillus cellulosilyticus]|uniref:GDP-4-dehydro-6-deoxy-D-mannose reductase n=1 Tax=Paenibacillus cellulosilyticus TaxID=375489 RepID=A0A2V2YZM7_9BACL|nr:GDP-mannose 4,6-dehydratase [Paenibacillus cellulosilyticus]PWW07519.1 GDP-4-dehydro-6-deoxy-D-mannose reductase [Paenibacillus cellulosilyticus]QKS44328.1 GDP-mannose 4,6-dehydratase [Paenibacillus cellulosilyticus]